MRELLPRLAALGAVASRIVQGLAGTSRRSAIGRLDREPADWPGQPFLP